MSKKKKKKAGPSDPTAPVQQKFRHQPGDAGLKNKLLIGILLITFISFFPILKNDFLNFDDPQYVTENPAVQQLNAVNLKRYFKEPFVGNYQPIVMLSYAIQYKLFGKEASGFHFFSLMMHLLNTALVFFLAHRLLRNIFAAAITALLFGIHPLHVESVAWIASQKDVIYTFFFLGASLFYMQAIRDGERKRTRLMLLSMLCFVLSLLSKAQAVVLPVVFLLFDLMLNRKENSDQGTLDHTGSRKVPLSKLFIEKIPFFALSFLFGILAIKLQQGAGAMQDFNFFKPYERVLFACYGFMAYIIQVILPVKLGIFYAYPEVDGKINTPLVYLAPFAIIALGLFVFFIRKRSRELVFGSLFFCVTIALVIQIIPVGDAIHADRYTYISLIGIFIFIGHLFVNIFSGKNNRNLAILASIAVFGTLSILTFIRSGVFKDNVSVYSDSLRNHPAAIIYSNLGAELYKFASDTADPAAKKKLFEDALQNIIEAKKLKPRFPNVWFNSGLASAQLGKVDEALNDYTEALKYNPGDFNIYMQRGGIYKAKNNIDAAISDYTKVIEINSGVIDAYYMRAELYGKTGKLNEAIADYDKVTSMKPDYAEAYSNRAITYSIGGNLNAALNDFNKAIQLNPKLSSAYFNRSYTLKIAGRFQEALADAVMAKNLGYPVTDQYMNEVHSLSGK